MSQTNQLSQVNLLTASAISGDGRVVVGTTGNRASSVIGGTKTELLQINSGATSVSANGAFIGGWTSVPPDNRAFVIGPNGTQDVQRPLGLTGTLESWQTEGVSDSGTTYVLANDYGGAFRFGTYAVGTYVDRLPLSGSGAISAVVKDITPNGNRAVGWLNYTVFGNTEKRPEPCFWDGLGNPVRLSVEDNNILTFFDRGRALGISADGTRIVGWVNGITGRRACYWNVSNPGVAVILDGEGGSASACSSNGSVIVGSYTGGSQNGRAAMWVNGELNDLASYLDSANYIQGFLGSATDVSADGKVILGSSYTGGPWIATLDAAPVAVADSCQAPSNGGAFSMAAPGVLGNDKYIGGEHIIRGGSYLDSAIAVKVSEASYGTVQLNTDGSFTYTPTAGVNFYGHDSFTYKVIRAGLQNDASSQPITVTVDRSKVSTLTSASTTLKNLGTTTATVELSQPAPIGGTEVTLGASSIFDVPTKVTVPGGQTSVSFPIKARIVDQTFSRPVWATHNGITMTTYLTVEPDDAKLHALSFDKGEIASQLGGAIGKVQMTAKVPTDTVVSLTCNSSALAMPSAVTILAGSDSRTFNVSGNLAATTVVATVTAQDQAGLVRTATIRIVASPLSLTFPNNTVIGGLSTTGVVTLAQPAGPGGVTVTISESTSIFYLKLLDPNASTTTVVIPEGEVSGSFTLYTEFVSTEMTRTVMASLPGLIDGSVNPPAFGNYTKIAAVTVRPLL